MANIESAIILSGNHPRKNKGIFKNPCKKTRRKNMFLHKYLLMYMYLLPSKNKVLKIFWDKN